MRYFIFSAVLVLALGSSCFADDFTSNWSDSPDRFWAGPDYWANRLQDWQIIKGRLECVVASQRYPLRTVHLLTARLEAALSDLNLSVRTGLIKNGDSVSPQAATGFLLGAGTGIDYRAAAVIHCSYGPNAGLFAGVDATGRLFIQDLSLASFVGKAKNKKLNLDKTFLAHGQKNIANLDDIEFSIEAKYTGKDYSLTLTCSDFKNGTLLDRVILDNIPAQRLIGNCALISHPGTGKNPGRFWFRNWKLSGAKLKKHDNRHCGPIICTQHTLSNGILKMTAQLLPLADTDSKTVSLQTKDPSGNWKTISNAPVIVPGYTATFRLENWDASKDTPYKVVYDLVVGKNKTRQYDWPGTVRRDPAGKSRITVAAFTGNHNMARGLESGVYTWTDASLWFPHNDLVTNITKHQPDVLFFSGDQVYESASPTRPDISSLNNLQLDYLYKWYLWCWAFGDLAKDIPCICLPDDHDVYQGNLWGQSGRPAKNQGLGGYVRDPEFVKMVERTQTSHLPDPYDPTPVQQGIGVYYSSMNYGDVSFAIIEDRKFKIGKESEQANSQDPTQMTLLGDRQLKFLADWGGDWSGGALMKSVLSQTVFACVHTGRGPDGSTNRAQPSVDYDSNGWPSGGRNRALQQIRKGFAFHIAGDQHLATIVHHGIEEHNDAGYSFCVPSIANYFPRSWRATAPGGHHIEGMPDYAGEFKDGFGNYITVCAAANPGYRSGVEPAILHDKSPGYGIVHFNKGDRTIEMQCWPRYADPADPQNGSQYPGWPKTISMFDNYGRKALAYLPKIVVKGTTDPVVQVIDQLYGDIVYTVRIKGTEFTPKVFRDGLYTIKVSQPDKGLVKILPNVDTATSGGSTLNVSF